MGHSSSFSYIQSIVVARKSTCRENGIGIKSTGESNTFPQGGL